MTNVLFVAPGNGVVSLKYHWQLSGPSPIAVTLKSAVVPGKFVRLPGCSVIEGGSSTVNAATALVTELKSFVANKDGPCTVKVNGYSTPDPPLNNSARSFAVKTRFQKPTPSRRPSR